MKPIFDDYQGVCRVRTCTLMITHACNLNCVYCYEEYKNNEYMTVETALQIIQNELQAMEKSNLYDAIQFDFMGGEPLMNFPLIREVVEWIEAHPPHIPFIFFASTNGTLLTPEMEAWFFAHRENIWLGASCDGTESMQNTNRGTNHKAINFDFFKKTWPLQHLHMTISRETLPHLADGVLMLQRDRGFRVEAALAQGVDWTRNDAVIYWEQLRELGETYLMDESLQPINLLGQNLLVEQGMDSTPIAPQQKFCGTGIHMITYDIDGRMYGCHLFTPVVLGDSRAEINHFDWKNCKLYNDERCNQCVLRQTCPTCAGFNFKYRGAIGKRDMRGCRMAFAKVLAACEFQLKLIAKRRSDELLPEEALKAQQALQAYQILKDIPFPNSDAPYCI